MAWKDLLTKYSPLLVIGVFISISIIVKFGILFFLLLVLFYFLLYHAYRIYSELFNEKNPKYKLRKMLAGKVVFDNNIWMGEEYKSLFENIKYLCKEGKYKVVLFKIQLEEIANIRNKAKDEDSLEYQMAELAIQRIEDFQKSKLLTLEDKLEKSQEKKEEKPKEKSEQELSITKEITLNIKQESPKPKNPPLPTDPKEAIHKSYLIESLITRLSSKKEYTFVSLNPELRVRLRAYLMENSNLQVDIVEVKAVEKQAKYVDKQRMKRLEKLLSHKAIKKTKEIPTVTKKIYQLARNLKKH